MLLSTFTGSNVFQLIVYLVVFAGIIILTYFVTKWIAGYQKGQITNRNFEVIETMKVASNRFLQIVRVGRDEYYVIGIGKDEINILGKLSREQIVFGETNRTKGGFTEVLASFKDNIKRNPDKGQKDDKGDGNED